MIAFGFSANSQNNKIQDSSINVTYHQIKQVRLYSLECNEIKAENDFLNEQINELGELNNNYSEIIEKQKQQISYLELIQNQYQKSIINQKEQNNLSDINCKKIKNQRNILGGFGFALILVMLILHH